MKKSTIVSLIVAASCVAAGLIVAVVGLCMAVLSGDNFSGEALPRTETVVEEDFHSISVEVDTADVIFAKAEDGVSRVVCVDHEYMQYAVAVRDGVLTVTAEDTRRWYEHIEVFSRGESTVTVYLAADAYESLSVTSSTGDMTLPQALSFSGTVSLKASTGDIQMSAPSVGDLTVSLSTGHLELLNCGKAGKVDIRTTTGDVTLRGLSCVSLAVAASSGDLTAENVRVEGAVAVTRSSGDVRMSGITCESLTARSNTGDQDYTDLLVRDKLDCRASTGDVTLTRSDAATLAILTDTGDVTASLLSPKIVYAETDTGSVQIPHTTEGGVFEITTDTGDIRVQFEE
jgi:DUF4097 and DUF4098 domain-containing protein YvlB